MLSRCPHCDRPFVVTDDRDRPRCPHCGKDAEEPQPAAPEGPASVVAEGSQPHPLETGGRRRHGVRPPPPRFENGRPAFEQRERGLLGRFFGTLADACLRPMAFFTHLSREGVRGITWFGYVCLLLGTIGQAAWGLLSLPFVRAMLSRSTSGLTPEQVEAARAEDSAVLNFMLDAMENGERVVEQLALVEAQLWATLVLAPLTAFFTIHLLAGLVHFSVQTFRPPSEEPVPYDVTYRFVVYSFAPMALGVIPTLGGLAGLFSFVLLFIAVGRLHRVRLLGLVAGVLMPVLLLSWLWDQEALPRIAPPLARALGVVEEVAPAQPPAQEADDEGLASASEYPPMPPPDRDHSVEVFEKSGWLYSERTWDSSLGRLHIKQLVAKEAGPDGRLLVIEVTNHGEQDVERLFVDHKLPGAVQVADEGRATQAAVEVSGHPREDIFIETVKDLGQTTWYLAKLPAAGKAVLAMKVVGGADARALFETAPSVGRTVRPAEETAP